MGRRLRQLRDDYWGPPVHHTRGDWLWAIGVTAGLLVCVALVILVIWAVTS
jgi:hypothetical protein